MDVIKIEIPECSGPERNCMPSLLFGSTTSAQQVANAICESFDFGASLEKVYPILRYIFRYLKATDLKSAEKISNVWECYAHEELARRNELSWLSVYKLKRWRLVLEKSPNFDYDDALFALVFVNRNCNMILEFEGHDFKDTCYILNNTVMDYLKREIIPKNRDYWVFTCKNVHRMNMIPSSRLRTLFWTVLIPRIPNVLVHRFCSPMKGRQDCERTVRENLHEDDILDCLLVFQVLNQYKTVEFFMDEILKRQPADSFALCGGVVTTGIRVFNHLNERQRYSGDHTFCIAFTHKRDTPVEFDAFSMVLNWRDQIHMETKLSEFKQKTFLREQSFMIRICSVGRFWYENGTAVEDTFFPKTPAICFEANNQIGFNKFVNSEENAPSKKRKTLPRPCHHGSSVIVLLTWGPKL